MTTPNDMSIVFVVDDDVSVRESLKSLIRFAGWRPDTFASAQEFLARPRATVPRCLVLDVAMKAGAVEFLTVKAHRGQVMRKMKADSLPDLVTMAARLGLRRAAKH